MSQDPMVILVDREDNQIGCMPKLAAHQCGGHLHRAFSIFIFNKLGELLIQRRAASKYHFAALWSNTCCSHARQNIDLIEDAQARLVDELGFSTPLMPAFSFVYRAHDDLSGLTEHELDHVLAGSYDGPVRPNPEEASEVRWISAGELAESIRVRPREFTPWFRMVLRHTRRFNSGTDRNLFARLFACA